MADFTDWKLEDAQAAIDNDVIERHGSQEAYDENSAFIEDHDHWQDGDGWVGPDGGSNTETRALVLAAVLRQFTPRDAMGEVLDRMANALLRQAPDVDFVALEPADPEDETAVAEQAADMDELRGFLATWWDRKKLWSLVRESVTRSRWAGRGALRTWLAPGHLEEGGTKKAPTVLLPSFADFADALDTVQLSAPAPDTSIVHTDETSQEQVAVFLFEGDDEEKAELWYVDEKDQTVVRIVGNSGEGKDGTEEHEAVDLGGRLPIVEMEADLLITEPIRRQQKRLNFAESLLVRVAETGGFPERYTLNAEPGGFWSKDPPPDGPALKTTQHANETWYLHASPRTLGAAITTDLIGVVMKSGEGETRATPGVVFKDPTDPEFAIKSSRHAYRTILEECKQGHIVDDGTSEASGIAYQQARADYEDDLNAVRGALEALIRETLEVVIAWAEAMMADAPGYMDRYRVAVSLNVKSGPVTPDEQQQNNQNVVAGTLSAETAMALNGVEDVESELQRLRTSPESVVALRAKQIAAVTELNREGVPFELAAEIVGIVDEEVLALFKKADTEAETAAAQEGAQDGEIADVLAGTGAGA